ncbi:MAG: hypothetical protein KGD64_10005 [Candidatus Heimdallarchaeota archaeon]|nr:hypothetical protein [Candidatus Heimdallarchaeota archaeon]
MMLVLASFLSNRVAKKREIETKEIIGKADIIPEKNVIENDSKTRENNEEETD